MKEFNAKLIESKEAFRLEISGPIDTESRFPRIQVQKPVTISFSNVTLMNSYGIKQWCKWVADHQHLTSVTLEQCPFVFAKNFSSIRGFLGPSMKVKSFFVPYYSDQSHESKNVLMCLNADFTEDGFLKVPKVLDSKGSEMEIDVDEKSYFQFLKKS